jgi:PAP2 superfamily
MAPITVRPTQVDVEIADAIAAHTGPRTEQAAELITWGADEHVLCALAVGWWLYSRSGESASRCASNHVLMTTLVSSALPHILKKMFDQERPDRLTVRGHWRGVPFSGKWLDAFPSGHAVHIGALASAASVLPSRQRNTLWAIGVGLVLTRIVLLAHWTSDVAAGLVVGALTERLMRRFTGYPNSFTRKTLARRHAFKVHWPPPAIRGRIVKRDRMLDSMSINAASGRMNSGTNALPAHYCGA